MIFWDLLCLQPEGKETLKWCCACWSSYKVWYTKYSSWVNAKAWFFCFRSEILVLAKYDPKIKILTLSWNFMPMLIRVCRSQGNVHVSIFDQTHPFWVNLLQKKKINCLSWNLLDYCSLSMQNSMFMFTFSVLIQKYLVCKIWKIHWRCSLFFVLTGRTFFGQILSKKSKLSIYSEIWYMPRLILNTQN